MNGTQRLWAGSPKNIHTGGEGKGQWWEEVVGVGGGKTTKGMMYVDSVFLWRSGEKKSEPPQDLIGVGVEV